ncbi:MAG TPA: carboxypeptidase-like regulatory domain-containing protein [Chitinophagaceae bacterium]|nr:carboxypeptidase-like regulatory domain-containing protein [Chitinophagaceae bacterium]
MKKRILLLLTFFSTIAAFAQLQVSGHVVDAETAAPLEGASVFAQNTTRGTTTAKDGSFTLPLSKGGYELIVTYTGYKKAQQNIQAGTDDNLTIKLNKEDGSLSEVVITSSNEVADGWVKYGSFFTDHFIGTTPFADSCAIQNPEVLHFYFYKRSNKLKVLATEPLQIANKALGYQLNYTLDSFVYYYKTDINAYRGLCLYRPLQGTADEEATWAKNRQAAYNGSRLHFMRAYYDSSLQQEGFTVDLLSQTDNKKFNRVTNPYDTAYYLAIDSTADVELWFGAKASITYTKKVPDNRYLKQYGLPMDVGVQISYVDLLQPILIKPNGFFLEQRDWINQGYWSWKNLADAVPYDYEP